MQQRNGLINIKAVFTNLCIRHPRLNGGIQTIQLKANANRLSLQSFTGFLASFFSSGGEKLLHFHQIVAIIMRWLKPIHCTKMTTHANSNRRLRINLAMVGQIGPQKSGRFYLILPRQGTL
ncbi:MAG: hypothetical protein ACI85H_000581 [Paracoccaceae bacterium]|jgi:hypothetical protein